MAPAVPVSARAARARGRGRRGRPGTGREGAPPGARGGHHPGAHAPLLAREGRHRRAAAARSHQAGRLRRHLQRTAAGGRAHRAPGVRRPGRALRRHLQPPARPSEPASALGARPARGGGLPRPAQGAEAAHGPARSVRRQPRGAAGRQRGLPAADRLPPRWSSAGDAAAAAMRLLSSTDALIIDLRGNGGGDGELVALYLGWLLPAPVHVLDTVWKGRKTEQLHTPAQPLAGRYGDKEVYVLTDGHTFSSAETLAYDLQARKRARLVGERTRGGANPPIALPVDEHFVVGVPMGQTVHAVTKTNWEGVGVKPDVPVAAEDALRTAHVAALTALVKRAADPEQAGEIQAALESLGAKP
ncbi:S41 family peptidase [Pyxidicoccus sp. 3LG]